MKRCVSAVPRRQLPSANRHIPDARLASSARPAPAARAKNDATARTGYGYFIVTSCGHVNFMGSIAKRCLARFFPAARNGQHLPAALARWTASHDPGPHCWECGGRRVVAWRVDTGRKGTGCYCVHETSTALSQLSPDELEILYWIGAGKTNDEIARNVGCALGTVKKHLGNIYQLLGVENRVGAAGYAREFLPEPPP